MNQYICDFILVFFFLNIIMIFCKNPPVTYMSLEHSKVVFYDRKYIEFMNISTRRFSRKDPVHYSSISIKTLVPTDKEVKVNFYFLQFLSNRYQRSFVEFHVNWCEIFEKKFWMEMIGHILLKGIKAHNNNITVCPLPPGVYHFTNMSVPPEVIPRSVPFTKGRLIINLTDASMNKVFIYAYSDMELITTRL